MYGPKGGNRGSRPHLKNHKNIGFPSIIGPDPLKSQSYQATIQCWAIISTQAKCHLNGVSQAGRPMMAHLKRYLDPTSPQKLKKNVVKVGPPLTKFSGSAHVWCLNI